MIFNCIVDASHNGMSLLQFLKKRLTNYSNKKIKTLLEMGCVTINGAIERFSSKKIFQNDSITFKSKKIIRPKSAVVLFEDEHFLAIDKPINFESSQENIHTIFPNCYLVHRLDKQTTGVLLIAKTKKFKLQLERLFKARMVKKHYLALVDGVLKKSSGIIESYFHRKKTYQGQTIWSSSSLKNGLYAKTEFNTIKTYNDFSLVELFPTTGRTHQLRVHLKELNHPILGDFQYAKNFKSTKVVSSLCLHAYRIFILHPITNQDIMIEAKFPSVFSMLE